MGWKWRNRKKIFQAGYQKRIGIVILQSDKINIKLKLVTRDKESHYIMIKVKYKRILHLLTSAYPITCLCVNAWLCLTLWSHGQQPTRLFCPWNISVKNIGVGCHFLLQGTFSTQGSNSHLLHLLHRRWILCPWAIVEANAPNIGAPKYVN